MPTPTRGLHSTRLGIKKRGKSAQDYMTDLNQATVTIDPPSLATMTSNIATATVPGALPGDMVEVFAPYDLLGIIVQGSVSAADTVKLTFFNATAGTVDLPSGSYLIKAVRG